MKQKFNFKRKKTNKAKKVLLGIGVGFLALAAAAGTAWALNNHYEWVELPAWMNPPVEEVVEIDHAVVIMANEQYINEFDTESGNFSGFSPSAPYQFDLDEHVVVSMTSDLTKITFDASLPGYSIITFYENDLQENISLPYELENGFIYDFSEFTVVAGEALVPVITTIV